MNAVEQQTYTNHLIDEIIQILDSKKANDITVIDLQNKGYMTQFVVIATAMVGKHAVSMLNYLKEILKPQGVKFYAIDEESEDWIIIDLGEVMIHIFTQNHRNKYNLEDFLYNTFCSHATQ